MCVVGLALLMGCAGVPTPEITEPPVLAIEGLPLPPTIDPSLLPTAQAERADAPSATGATPTAAVSTLPYNLTGYEIIAANTSPGIYSGYSCVIAEIGCACETPIFEQITFDFTVQDKLVFEFGGEGYSGKWDLSRLGVNHWGYSVPLFTEDGSFSGKQLALMTFTDTGFVRTLSAELNGTFVTCPDVFFRRVASSD